MHDMQDSHPDPFEAEAEMRRAAERAAFRAAQEREDWLGVASTPEGRRVLRGLMNHCRVGQPIWQPDEAQLHYACGKQAAGLEIVNKVREHAPEFLTQLLQDEE